MLQRVFVDLYRMPIGFTVVCLVGALLFWCILTRYIQQAGRKQRILYGFFCGVVFLVWVLGVLYITVLMRTPGEREVHWQPFYQLQQWFAGGPKELLRTLWMNVLLFVPGGLFLSAQLPARWPWWVRIPLVLIVLIGLSVGIEWLQYQYALGVVEADDLLCNTLGAVLGVFIQEWALYRMHKRAAKDRN